MKDYLIECYNKNELGHMEYIEIRAKSSFHALLQFNERYPRFTIQNVFLNITEKE